jgi:hypothetical protein
LEEVGLLKCAGETSGCGPLGSYRRRGRRGRAGSPWQAL